MRDILVALRRRAPHLPVILYPTLVQGEGSAERIATAIATAGERQECDVLIVARGGGSIEDLWAFNEEPVARAIAASALPVVSGVGHETDVTIADFAADLRAATPTAAAELASAGWYAAADEVDDLTQRLRGAMDWQINNLLQRLDWLQRRLVHPAQRIAQSHQHLAHLATRLAAASRAVLRRTEQHLGALSLRLTRRRPDPARESLQLDRLRQRLQSALQQRLQHQQSTVERLAASLSALNPQATLARGYSIVRDEQGAVVSSPGQLHPGSGIRLQFATGEAAGRIESITTGNAGKIDKGN